MRGKRERRTKAGERIRERLGAKASRPSALRIPFFGIDSWPASRIARGPSDVRPNFPGPPDMARRDSRAPAPVHSRNAGLWSIPIAISGALDLLQRELAG